MQALPQFSKRARGTYSYLASHTSHHSFEDQILKALLCHGVFAQKLTVVRICFTTQLASRFAGGNLVTGVLVVGISMFE